MISKAEIFESFFALNKNTNTLHTVLTGSFAIIHPTNGIGQYGDVKRRDSP